MKRGSLVFVSMAFLCLFAIAPLTGQSGEQENLQTYTIDNFDNAEELAWSYKAGGSKFIVEGYPKLRYFNALPRPLHEMYEDHEKAKVLGLQMKFNRKGDNWADIYPVKDGELYEIPFKGIIKRLELWVWGTGYYYDIEVLVRDVYGRVHTLPLGLVNYKGWRNLTVTVPGNIPQASKYLGNKHKMTLVCFRIRTRPSERVDDFKIYFDDFKALTNVFINSFDGYELAGADFGGEDSEGKENTKDDAEEVESDE